MSRDIYIHLRSVLAQNDAFSTVASEIVERADSSSSSNSAYTTRLSIGIGVGIGFLVFSAFWALAFVVWTRRNELKKAQKERGFIDGPDDRRPPVPEKDVRSASRTMTIRSDSDVVVDQYGRRWRREGGGEAVDIP
ncbi:hypothetical protein GLAREA_07187 [Glarea lozoyensis ATCC 20868]|uniref:Uncharacterized protein n=1 Tax=Glarea lozoyensis (strain ATCC 20868 / MF5171) TaxID=1116229 RepID=S3DAN1_GLAL2|nr:uncharacterized protein GLAREA_07187 [Glarea lozoyensis ATCC 20868]EPE34174.1 hypothetical protein GLAREA_07187 [Glarea lozoyensis ATCC 20868]